MSTLAIVERPQCTDAERLAKGILARMDSIVAKLRNLEDDIRKLWDEFDKLKDGETILGCKTKKEFCKRKLHRTPRALQYLLYGRTEAKPAPAGEQCSPGSTDVEKPAIPSAPSNRELRRRAFKQDHPEFEGKKNSEVDAAIQAANFAQPVEPLHENLKGVQRLQRHIDSVKCRLPLTAICQDGYCVGISHLSEENAMKIIDAIAFAAKGMKPFTSKGAK